MKYILKRELWICRLYFEIANKKNYSYLTIDFGKSGPAKCRTNADNNLTQTCYYTQKKKDRLFDKFITQNLNENNQKLTLTIDTTLEKAIKWQRQLP